MRKPQIQPSLASLTLAEREQLADWLRHGHYNDVLDRATKPRPDGLGLTFTSDKPLRTFYAKVALFDVINAQLPADKKLSLATFESLGQRHIHLFLAASGDEEKLAAAHQAILNTTVELASSGDNSPTQLLALQRLADFPERAAIRAAKEQRAQAKAERDQEMHEHKIALDLRKEADRKEMNQHQKNIAERNTALREAHLKLAEKKLRAESAPAKRNGDHLGPFARNWDDISERARIHFGVSKEEWARRTGANEEQAPIEDTPCPASEVSPSGETLRFPVTDNASTNNADEVEAPFNASLSQQGTPIRDLNSRSERLSSGDKIEAALGTQPNVSNGGTNSGRAWEAIGLGEGFSTTPTTRTGVLDHIAPSNFDPSLSASSVPSSSVPSVSLFSADNQNETNTHKQ